MLITKRDGSKVTYDPSKINQFLEYVCEGINGVSMSDIMLSSKLFLHEHMTTKEINSVMIKSAEDLISEETPNYDLVAGRILISEIRKSAFGVFDPDPLYNIIKDNTSIGLYDPELLVNYSKEDIEYLESHIDYDRDYNIAIAGAREWADKYLVQNRITKQYYECPQIAYMLVAMAAFMYDEGNENKSRLDFVVDYYNILSLGLWNCPTPQMAGLRTPTRTFSSCVLIEVDDSIDGISTAEQVGKKYSTLKAGIGIGSHNLRGNRQPIRGGEAINTGVLSHAKSIEESILSCSQGNIRKGSITFNWLGWHIDFEDLIYFKNSARLDSDSMKKSDHMIMLNGYLLRRALTGKAIWLFSPEEVPALKKAFFSSDLKLFAELYEEAIENPNLTKKSIPGDLWFTTILTERQSTGRIYLGFMDNFNKYSGYNDKVAPVRQSNLCVEISQHTEPVKIIHNDDGTQSIDGLVALCNLGGINWGPIKAKEDFIHIAEVGVRALDNILSMQYYPFEASRKHNEMYRPIGVGITGFAYWLARNGLKYDNCYKLLDEWADYWSYAVTLASVNLAKERGHCGAYANTKWARGIMPVDIVPDAVNEIIPHQVRSHWEELRPMLKQYGIRNASLMALMPAETSAKISGRGTTNGVEPVRGLIVSKGGKSSKGKFVVPEFEKLKDNYDLVWEWEGCSQLIKTYAILQKYVDQAISGNTYYNKNNFPDEKIPLKLVASTIVDAYKYGLKTLYYNNNDDSVKEFNVSNEVSAVLDDDASCEACTL